MKAFKLGRRAGHVTKGQLGGMFIGSTIRLWCSMMSDVCACDRETSQNRVTPK